MINQFIYTLLSCLIALNTFGQSSNQITEEQRQQILDGVPAKDVLTREQRLSILAGVSSSSKSEVPRSPFLLSPITYLNQIQELSKELEGIYDTRTPDLPKLQDAYTHKQTYWSGLDKSLLQNEGAVKDFLGEIKGSEGLVILIEARLKLLKEVSTSPKYSSLYEKFLLDNAIRIELVLQSLDLGK